MHCLRNKTISRAVNSAQPARRGAILLIAMVCVLVVSLIGTTLLQMALTERRQLQKEQARLQAGWLLESALERAVVQLRRNSEYRGEVWQVTLNPSGRSQIATMNIEVEPVPDLPNRRELHLVAECPQGSEQRARSSRRTVIDIDPSVE